MVLQAHCSKTTGISMLVRLKKLQIVLILPKKVYKFFLNYISPWFIICSSQNITTNSNLNTLSLLSILMFSQEAFFFGEFLHCNSCDSDISDNTSSYSPSVNRHRECLSYTTSSLPKSLFESPSLLMPLRIFRLFIDGSTFSSPC